MAKYQVTYRCGHTDTVGLFGSAKQRENKLTWLETSLCTECWKAQQAADAANKARAMELPELTGTEKQVNWAQSIRIKLLDDVEFFLSELERCNKSAVKSGKGTQEQLDAINEKIAKVEGMIKQQSEAKWWIDHRFDTGKIIVTEIYKQMK